jgi:hypothetical protein
MKEKPAKRGLAGGLQVEINFHGQSFGDELLIN